jgi:hypothetical protein
VVVERGSGCPHAGIIAAQSSCARVHKPQTIKKKRGC